MKSDARLKELLRVARCWGGEPSGDLARCIEEERKRITPPADIMRTLVTLRKEWAQAAISQKRNRHVRFLGAVYEEVIEWRRLRRQEELLAGLREHFEVPLARNVFQALLLTVCGSQIDRKIRYRWAACLREVEHHKTPAKLGAAQIIRLGGINRCAVLAKRKAGKARLS